MGRRSRSPSSRSSRRRSRSGSRSPRGNRSRRRDEKDRSRERDKEKKRDRSRDRDDRKSSRGEKSSSNTKAIIEAKRRLRDGLVSARSEFSGLSMDKDEQRDEAENMSLNEQASRAREIDRIEDGGFQPAQFKSSVGGAGGRVYGHKQTKKETKVDKVDQSEKDHDKAIFGPAWRSKEQTEKETPEKQDQGDIPIPVPIPREPAALIHPNFLTDINVRKQKWLEAWREQRTALGIV